MKHLPHQAGRAFTLLEILTAIVILSVISAVVMPVVLASSDSYATARDIRNQTERMADAVDRITRMIRQAPIGGGDTGVGVRSATPEVLVFTDGTGFDLVAGRLRMHVPGGDTATLCQDIDAIEISYLGDDGLVSTLATPERSHRIAVRITSGNLTVSTVAHPRVWIGQGS